nr:PREDICTED: matrix metalloproteinase-20-like isoform X2 [Latimeria chalumnae]|eukprot:XP_014345482.1 PREDICTED: matrix metalloproteinase-20-like isoform X2 [Latimeria chalumnae]
MKFLWISILGAILYLGLSLCSPMQKELKAVDWNDLSHAEEYLKTFYSLGKGSIGRTKRESGSLEKKITEMQDFFGLQITGKLDSKTLDMMRKARCGVPDVENYKFYPDKPRWNSNTVTYRILKYSNKLKSEEVDKSLKMALKLWSDVTPLNFVKTDSEEADIKIMFGSKDHGDFFPFDGPRGILAHSFEPGDGLGGDTHFDEDEKWTMGNIKQGYNLFTVAAHEFGHALGLGHSRDPTALMFPIYKYRKLEDFRLPRDDVQGIQALYGSQNKERDLTKVPEKCDPQFSFDAVTNFGRELLFFKQGYDEHQSTMDDGYPQKIKDGFTGVGSKVDAVFEMIGFLHIFAGPKAYKYDYKRKKVLYTVRANAWLGC